MAVGRRIAALALIHFLQGVSWVLNDAEPVDRPDPRHMPGDPGRRFEWVPLLIILVGLLAAIYFVATLFDWSPFASPHTASPHPARPCC